MPQLTLLIKAYGKPISILEHRKRTWIFYVQVLVFFFDLLKVEVIIREVARFCEFYCLSILLVYDTILSNESRVFFSAKKKRVAKYDMHPKS